MSRLFHYAFHILSVSLNIFLVYLLSKGGFNAWEGYGWSQPRLLGGNGDTSTHSNSTGCDGTDSHDAHHTHSQYAMFFLLVALFTGTMVMHFVMKFNSMQETTMLFILGMISSILIRWAELDDMDKYGASYSMWMGIEPHLLLYTLLPPLLTGDAMTIDTTVARRVAYQCLYMAGPGVLIQAFTVAGLLYWYFQGWSFFLCLATGAILCATDPVAVVALLKELGASPVLTVQIQGESLVNDGTSIVLYAIAYNMLTGIEYDEAEILDFFLKTALMAWALGMFIGYVFFLWIRMAGDKLEHMSSMIQITLTLCCAYFSFVVAEGVLGISGVLSTVAASFILADNMWPHIVSVETMHNVWHAFEQIGNIIIFFLGGAITGKNMYNSMEIRDLVDLGLIYVVLILVRTAFIFVSRPVLRLLSADKCQVSLPDAMVMSWGGLRGAVGLALAIEVSYDQAKDTNGVPQISANQADKVLFFVSGVAFLTTVINATTAPMLVRRLGILSQSYARLQLQKMLWSQLVEWTINERTNPEITESLQDMVNVIGEAIRDQKVATARTSDIVVLPSEASITGSEASCESTQSTPQNKRSTTKESNHPSHSSIRYGERNNEIIVRLTAAELKYQSMEDNDKRLFKLPPDSLLGHVESLKTLVDGLGVDVGLAKAVNATFLQLVGHCYKEQMEHGLLTPGSEEAKSLVTSVRMTQSRMRPDLTDFQFILDQMHKNQSGDFKIWWRSTASKESTSAPKPLQHMLTKKFQALTQHENSRFHQFMSSTKFTLGMSVIILLNVLYVLLAEVVRNEENADNIMWEVIEVLFALIFIVEFVLKFKDEGCKYFQKGGNMFDFFLVIVGTFGCIVVLSTRGTSNDLGASEARTLRFQRIVRIFRVLRLLRIFRIFRTQWDFVSPETVAYMKTIRVFTCFVNAHTTAQTLLMKYFGFKDQFNTKDKAEIARCICQSQCAIYQAISLTVSAKKQMDPATLVEMENVAQRLHVTEGLEQYILQAHECGAISEREAEAILHPLRHKIQEFIREKKYLGMNKQSSLKTSIAWVS